MLPKRGMLNSKEQAEKFLQDAGGNFETAFLLWKAANDAANNREIVAQGVANYWIEVKNELEKLQAA